VAEEVGQPVTEPEWRTECVLLPTGQDPNRNRPDPDGIIDDLAEARSAQNFWEMLWQRRTTVWESMGLAEAGAVERVERLEGRNAIVCLFSPGDEWADTGTSGNGDKYVLALGDKQIMAFEGTREELRGLAARISACLEGC
jgi:hypothetical protein